MMLLLQANATHLHIQVFAIPLPQRKCVIFLFWGEIPLPHMDLEARWILIFANCL